MKICLITLAAFPCSSAESIHLAMFSKSMAEFVDYKLITPYKWWRRSTWTNRLDNYGISDDAFNQKKYPQITKKAKFFIRKALDQAELNNALVYCRQFSVVKAAISRKMACVWEIHAVPDLDELMYIKKAVDDGVLKKIVVISSAIESDVRELVDINPDTFFLAPDAADESKFKVGPLSSKLRIGYIGSAYKGKGVEVVVPLAKACPDLEFLFYGADEEELLGKGFSDLPSNLVVKGRIPYAAVPDAMNSFDIALLPNQPDVIVANGNNIGKYTSPMKMFEYMAAGKVIVASDLDIIKEILTDEKTAKLVQHDNVTAWKRAINDLAANPQKCEQLRTAANKLFLDKYTYRSRARGIVHTIAPAFCS